MEGERTIAEITGRSPGRSVEPRWRSGDWFGWSPLLACEEQTPFGRGPERLGDRLGHSLLPDFDDDRAIGLPQLRRRPPCLRSSGTKRLSSFSGRGGFWRSHQFSRLAIADGAWPGLGPFAANAACNLFPIATVAAELLDQGRHLGPHEIRQRFAWAGSESYRARTSAALAFGEDAARIVAETLSLT
jgi:hypothetical protein